MPLKNLYFGGSFNPPHLAHTACSSAVAVALKLQSVVLVPTGQSALKNVADLAPAADRLAMTRLAAEDANTTISFAVDDIEISRPGTSYTIDTVQALLARGEADVHWLIGADQLLNLHRWNQFERLLQIAHFHVMARPGYFIDWDVVHPIVRSLQNKVVTIPQMEISATDIRRRLRAEEPVDGLLSPKVREYVLGRRLYIE